MGNLTHYLNEFKNKRVLVIGDAVVDHYTSGIASKISPDAPVPLLDVTSEEYSFGSLGTATEFILNMGGKVDLISSIGRDFEGKYIIERINELKLKRDGIIEIGSFTPKITRILSHNQQMLRLEKKYNLSQESIKQLNKKVEGILDSKINECDVILILDYGLGFLNPILISQIMAAAKQKKKRVIVRPEDNKYFLYQSSFLIKMNRNIASIATGVEPLNETCMRIIGTKILNENHAGGVFIPWIEDDSYFFYEHNVNILQSMIQLRPKSYWGIGSSIMATMSLMSTTQAEIDEIIQVAHYAGSIMATKNQNDYLILEDLKRVIETGKISAK